MNTQCIARVKGTGTYMLRNTEFQCKNTAQDNGFCHVHQSKAVTPMERSAFEELKATLNLNGN